MSVTGLDVVRRAFERGGFGRGIGRTLGFKGIAAEAGRVVLEGTPNEDHFNPLGTVHGGYAATMLDGAMALAVYSTLPADTGYSTLDLKITYLRALTGESGPVRAEGSVLHGGKTVIAAEGRLEDKDGRLCAHAIATCIVSPPRT